MNMDQVGIHIDFSAADSLNESWLRMFGTGISAILRAMFGGNKIPVTVKGSPQEVRAFSKVLGSEKSYMDAYRKFGLNNPTTYKSRFRLNKSVRDFERVTGITYPLR